MTVVSDSRLRPPTERDTMGSILDDVESRPGSTTSLLRTIIGLYLRRLDGWISIADLIRLMEDLDVPDRRTRTAVVRLKKKELIVADRGPTIGYRLNPSAVSMLERGDRRIFSVRTMEDADDWCLVSFSIPEHLRDVRHQLRRRLHWIGCGTVAQALWICPAFLTAEVEEILDDLDVRQYATVFRTVEPRVAGTLPEAVAQWWDLDALLAEHEIFLAAVSAHAGEPVDSDRDAFVRYIRLIDSWRVLPYIDPGLPPAVLPADWPGRRSVELFVTESARLADPAWQYARSVVGARSAH
jgi:phenylacetic acid degradation operon negative regulatory protein